MNQSWAERASRCSTLTSTREGFVDELGGRIEVDAHVEGGGVVRLDAVVGDVHPRVILRATAPLALRAVEDVCDAQSGQLAAIWRHVSADRGGGVYSAAAPPVTPPCWEPFSQVDIQDWSGTVRPTCRFPQTSAAQCVLLHLVSQRAAGLVRVSGWGSCYMS